MLGFRLGLGFRLRLSVGEGEDKGSELGQGFRNKVSVMVKCGVRIHLQCELVLGFSMMVRIMSRFWVIVRCR